MEILRNIWYMARRFKTATALNFIGLTVAFAAFYLLMTQVVFNHSYNRCLKDYERIYRLETFMALAKESQDWQATVSRGVAEIVEQLPQVENIALMSSGDWEVKVEKDAQKWRYNFRNISHQAMEVFQAQLVSGRLTATDEDYKGCLIPVSLAQTIFGRIDVAGEVIKVDDNEVHIRGVYQDFPDNCSIQNNVYVDMGEENKSNFNNFNYFCYVKLREGVEPGQMLNGIAAQVKRLMHEQLFGQVTEAQIESMGGKDRLEELFEKQYGKIDYRLVPIADTYFSGVNPYADKGNKGMYLILQLACLLVILVAAINFLNFLLAESPVRVRGVNTRRVLGESLVSLRMKLLAEPVVTSVMACLFGLALVWLLSLMPTIGELFQGSIKLETHLGLCALCLLIAIGIGLLAGVYPARFMTSFAPALALKGSFGLTPRGRQLRTALICLQLFVSSLMVIYIGILYLQSHYIYTSDYGFPKDEVAYFYTNRPLREKAEALRSELLRQTGIQEVCFTQFVPATQDGYMSWGRGDEEHAINFTCFFVDHHFLRTMGIPIVEGRDFNEHDKGCYIINEAARKRWPWVELDKKLLTNDFPVVGVCKDIRFMSTRQRSDVPLVLLIPDDNYGQWGNQNNMVGVRIAAGTDRQEMRRRIHDIIMKIDSTENVEVRFIDQHLEDLYLEENRFIRQVIGFSLVCLMLTLIGVFCLTMFETEYRRKEIGIRKVFGSSSAEILSMLSRRYVALILLAFVIATPVAWYFGKEWLQNFAERTPIYWWLFPLGLLLVAAVTLLTVAIQGWRAATENPINSIKTE